MPINNPIFIAPPANTLSNINALAAGNALVIGQLYYVTDYKMMVRALTVSTYEFQNGYETITSVAPNGTANAVFNISAYREILFDINAIVQATSIQALKIDGSTDNVVYTGIASVGDAQAANSQYFGTVRVFKTSRSLMVNGWSTISGTAFSPGITNCLFNFAAQPTHVRFKWDGGANFTGGTITALGVR